MYSSARSSLLSRWQTSPSLPSIQPRPFFLTSSPCICPVRTLVSSRLQIWSCSRLSVCSKELLHSHLVSSCPTTIGELSGLFYFLNGIELDQDFTAEHMDSYSGRCPQKFIPFCLGITSEKSLPESTIAQVARDEETGLQETDEPAVPIRPPSRVYEGSRSTDESVTAFIDERTVSEMAHPEVESAIILPAQQGSTISMTTTNIIFLEASVSEPIVVRNDQTQVGTGYDKSKEADSQTEAPGLYGDTTDAEDLMDSSGVRPSHRLLRM